MRTSRSLFGECWDRLERADEHRRELVAIWNEYVSRHPFDFQLRLSGEGRYVLRVHETEPLAPAFSLGLGEWLYQLRACLDHIIWATSAYQTGIIPPPDEHALQFPVYDSEASWNRNLYRIEHLAPHQQEMLRILQPFNGNKQANYLRVINRLAAIDRHRRLTVGTAYLAEAEPVIAVPEGTDAHMRWGQRTLVDGAADLVEVTVSPWHDGMDVTINPRVGLDPEVAEWTMFDFYAGIPLMERLTMFQLFVSGEVAAFEYDDTGSSQMSEMLTAEFREQCDRRGRLTAPNRARTEVEWGPAFTPGPSTQERLEGKDFPAQGPGG